MRATLMVMISVLFVCGTAVASVSVPPPFVMLNQTETRALQAKIARMAPDEFAQAMREPAKSGEPPLWRGPYTAPVIADAFRLLKGERAAELLSELWTLHDVAFPEESILFAAACFAELPDRESHALFAGRLDADLKKLLTSSWNADDRDSFNQLQFRLRAVGALARLWRGDDLELTWIKQQVTRDGTHPALRSQLLRVFSAIVNPVEKKTSPAGADNESYDTIRSRQLSHAWSGSERIHSVWSGHDWAHELYLPLIQSAFEHSEVRGTALQALAALPGQREVLKPWLLATAGDAGVGSRLRIQVIWKLVSIWGQEEQVMSLLATIMADHESGSLIRKSAMHQLARTAAKEPWFKEKLLSLASDSEDHAPVRVEALNQLERMPLSESIFHSIAGIVTGSNPVPSVQKAAFRLLKQKFGANPALKELLLPFAEGRQWPPAMRSEAIQALGDLSRKDAELKQRIIELMKSRQEHDSVRKAAFGALGLVWERKNNGWIKELLLPVATDSQDSVVFRKEVIWNIGQIWNYQPWIQETFTGILENRAEKEEVRATCVRALPSIWDGNAWMKELLMKFIGPEELHVSVRKDAIEVLSQNFREESWVAGLLVSTALSDSEPSELRERAVTLLQSHFPKHEDLAKVVTHLAFFPGIDPPLRARMIFATRSLSNTGEMVKPRLLEIARSDNEAVPARKAAIEAIVHNWNLFSWEERSRLLVAHAGPEERNPEIRRHAAYQLALMREMMAIW